MYNLLSLPKFVSVRVSVDKVETFLVEWITIKSSRLNIILYIRNRTTAATLKSVLYLMHKVYASQGYKFIILSTIKNTYINRWHNFEIIFQVVRKLSGHL